MNTLISNRDGSIASLLVASFGKVAVTGTGKWEPGFGFCLKVDETDAILMKVLPASAKGNDTNDYVETYMYPGWNPEIIKGIIIEDTNWKLVYGY